MLEGPNIVPVPYVPEEERRAKQAGIELALRQARLFGLKVGQIVAHMDDEHCLYKLMQIGDKVATVQDKDNSIYVFPKNELFDPNVANQESENALPDIILGKYERKH